MSAPPEIFCGNLAALEPRQLTRFNGLPDPAAAPVTRQIVYRSPDDKWDIEATLLLPPDYEAGRRYPLILELMGGPSIVQLSFDNHLIYPTRAMASRGYIVLRPNTRGRSFSAGERFNRAIVDELSFVANPWSDAIAGVDLLTAEGLVDPSRMGVLGHSYGAALTAYGITQTGRFAAASYHEGTTNTLLTGYVLGFDPVRSGWVGHGDLYDPIEFERARREAPLQNVHKVTTPTLIEVGALPWNPLTNFAMDGAVMARGLLDRGVPCDLVAYPRSGHVIEEVALILDGFDRNLAWFDYWLLDRVTPGWDLSRYDEWKRAHPRGG